MKGTEQHSFIGRESHVMNAELSSTTGGRSRHAEESRLMPPSELSADLRDPVPQNYDDLGTRLNQLVEHLQRIESVVSGLQDQKLTKDWYTPAEVAQILDKAPFTVREWARHGRIHAEKRRCGRGVAGEWMISHAELTRIRNEGLLPLPDSPWRSKDFRRH